MSGVLKTFTIIRSAPQGFEEKAPYCVGLVELEGSTRTVLIEGVEDSSSLEIGMPIDVVEGRYVIGFDSSGTSNGGEE
ncbi:OB-fold domain-containing protein [Corynebacterium sp. CNCTC7651]|uniref:Zn-ribbon domain-containing OB-fold protein n=1 Tax=Corynebacterium sp. CNCTC7651 TaxID=2815361 RepID=UPI00351D21A9|nr:OB-fold domain-containing protein [Corynebacterium sp. CNCTC7651]